ncbi:hypothetical protein [Paenibacillus guangzhouensis]|uniref:hypothetical protein n=1 Tax=Paenibacillus guangzhouensis TaxID=1473112 RepID=UPI001266CA4C|nr:hypothetical protein [Paenibacillus guangzhouensis]
MSADKLDKRKIIVREIHHWRESRLLPDQYCDFLLNLYQDHPDEQSSGSASKSSSWFRADRVMQWSWKRWLLGIVIFSLICFVVLHFKGFQPAMQIFTGILFIVCCYGFGAKIKRKNQTTGLMLIGVGSMTMITVGMLLLRWHQVDNELSVVSLVIGCSIIWLLIGIFLRVPLLHFCGWAGLLLIYGAFLTRSVPDPAWYEMELFWLPISGVMLWLSWYVHHKNKTGSAVLFLVGALLWFVPELHQMLYDQALLGLTQIALFVKIVVGAALLFTLRKKWIVWVV